MRRWALIVVGVVTLSFVVAQAEPAAQPPPMPSELRRFVNIAGGVVMGLGLLFALLDGLGAAQWELGPRDRNYSMLPIAPLAAYVTGGLILVRAHMGWRPLGLWVLFVAASFGVQFGLPALARAWASRR